MCLLPAPPLFVEPTISLTTTEGDETTLPCATFPDPTLTFTWSFNDVMISLPSDDGPTLLSNGSLFYPSAVKALEGSYVCTATNSLGSAQGGVQLTVLGESLLVGVCCCLSSIPLHRHHLKLSSSFPTVPPSLTPSPPTVTITEGDAALLTCAVIGDPLPVLMWYHMGTVITGENGTILTLEGVRKDQEGEYECRASNVAGEDQATVTLVVNSKSVTIEIETHCLIHHMFFPPTPVVVTETLLFFNSPSHC